VTAPHVDRLRKADPQPRRRVARFVVPQGCGLLKLGGDLFDQGGDGRGFGGEVEVEAGAGDPCVSGDLSDLNLAERSLGEQLLESAQDRGASCVALLGRGGRGLAAEGFDALMLARLTRVKNLVR